MVLRTTDPLISASDPKEPPARPARAPSAVSRRVRGKEKRRAMRTPFRAPRPPSASLRTKRGPQVRLQKVNPWNIPRRNSMTNSKRTLSSSMPPASSGESALITFLVGAYQKTMVP